MTIETQAIAAPVLTLDEVVKRDGSRVAFDGTAATRDRLTIPPVQRLSAVEPARTLRPPIA